MLSDIDGDCQLKDKVKLACLVSDTQTYIYSNLTSSVFLIVCSTKPLLGHHALVRVVGFRMAGFMLSGSGIRVCVLGNVELGWGGWGKVQFNVGG